MLQIINHKVYNTVLKTFKHYIALLHISNYFFEDFQYLSNVKYKHGI